jgi:hypothetical protein
LLDPLPCAALFRENGSAVSISYKKGSCLKEIFLGKLVLSTPDGSSVVSMSKKRTPAVGMIGQFFHADAVTGRHALPLLHCLFNTKWRLVAARCRYGQETFYFPWEAVKRGADAESLHIGTQRLMAEQCPIAVIIRPYHCKPSLLGLATFSQRADVLCHE